MTDQAAATALVRVDDATTDVRLPIVIDKRAMEKYLKQLEDPGALDLQKRLAKAYDAAVDALIGENDVQKEGARTFKKKSAWRKLARHFGITTSIVAQTERYVLDEATGESVFLASCVVRGVAPWGQSSEAAGACSTDEETGRRKITIADAISTAETRASNRATSNLIAMGEVSAEEASRESREEAIAKSVDEMTYDEAIAVPFPWKAPEKYKGKPLAAVSFSMLQNVVEAVTKDIAKNGPAQRKLEVKRAAELIIASRLAQLPAWIAQARELLGRADVNDEVRATIDAELSAADLSPDKASAIVVRLDALVEKTGADDAEREPGDEPAEAPRDRTAVAKGIGDAIVATTPRAYGLVGDPLGDDHFVVGNAKVTLCGFTIARSWSTARGMFGADHTSDKMCADCTKAALTLEG